MAMTRMAINYYNIYAANGVFIPDRDLQDLIKGEIPNSREAENISYNIVFLVILFRKCRNFINKHFPKAFVPQNKLLELAQKEFTEHEFQALLLIRKLINKKRNAYKVRKNGKIISFPVIPIKELKEQSQSHKLPPITRSVRL